MRIGIDVGGTNTDAVVMDGVNVVTTTKTPTTENVTDGIVSALRGVVENSNLDQPQQNKIKRVFARRCVGSARNKTRGPVFTGKQIPFISLGTVALSRA